MDYATVDYSRLQRDYATVDYSELQWTTVDYRKEHNYNNSSSSSGTTKSNLKGLRCTNTTYVHTIIPP